MDIFRRGKAEVRTQSWTMIMFQHLSENVDLKRFRTILQKPCVNTSAQHTPPASQNSLVGVQTRHRKLPASCWHRCIPRWHPRSMLHPHIPRPPWHSAHIRLTVLRARSSAKAAKAAKGKSSWLKVRWDVWLGGGMTKLSKSIENRYEESRFHDETYETHENKWKHMKTMMLMWMNTKGSRIREVSADV